jgi:hypothetical protein
MEGIILFLAEELRNEAERNVELDLELENLKNKQELLSR